MARLVSPVLAFSVMAVLGAPAYAQTTYYLHSETSETSSTPALLQLRTTGPDAALVAFQTGDLKNKPPADVAMRIYDTQSGVPNLSGVIASGSTITITLWMKKTSAFGTVYPQATVGLNWNNPTPLCQATGIPNQTPTQLITTTLAAARTRCRISTLVAITCASTRPGIRAKCAPSMSLRRRLRR